MAALIARDHREDKEFSSRSFRRRATATHAAAQSEKEGSNDSKEQDDEQLPASVLPICLGAYISSMTDTVFTLIFVYES